MDQIGNEGEQDAEGRPQKTKMLKHCPNCGGEVEIGGLYSPERGNSRVYFANGEGTNEEPTRLTVFAAVCRTCGQITLTTDSRNFG